MQFIVFKLPDEDDHKAKMEQLAGEVREAAYEGMEGLWSALLEVLDTDTARTVERALNLLTDMEDPGEAMKLVFALYALCEVEVPLHVAICADYPALARMFMDEFLTETGEYLTDVEAGELEDAVKRLD